MRELTLLERQVQVEKAKLVMRKDYSPEACLAALGLQASSRLTENDLYDLLTHLEIPCSSRHSQLLLNRYDSDEDGRLTCWDILQMLQPNDPAFLEKRPSEEGLGLESINTLKALLTQVMETEERAERIRQRLRGATKDLRGLFDKCDYLGRAQLTEIEINQLLRTHPSPEQIYDLDKSLPGGFSAKEVGDLILRFNKGKQNGRISMPEFVAELTPILI